MSDFKKEKVLAHLTTYGLDDGTSNHPDHKINKRWKKQRLERGFDDTELWCFYKSIAKFILPRLKEFKILDRGDDLKEPLDKMIAAFSLVVENDDSYRNPLRKEYKIFKEGFDLFHKHYINLWF